LDNPKKQPGGKRIGAVRRKTVSVSAGELVTTGELQPGRSLPLLVEPAVAGVNLITWAGSQGEFIETNLLKHGAILFRGFKVKVEAELEQLIRTISSDPVEYTYRSTPRSRVSGNIYTSTEYPADQPIPLHNEMAYTTSWPLKIWFLCLKAAEQQGETPIADSREVYRRISPRVRDRFAQKQVMYVRNYGAGIDLPWQDVFQTADHVTVETYCRQNKIDFEWKADDGLRTRQVCQAAAPHPRTDELVWFNQAHLFHASSLKPEIYESLVATFKEEDYPRNTYYGDGAPIEPEALAEIRAAYAQAAIIFPWQEGDVMMLDNMLVAHGRQPYRGSRKIVVGMAEPYALS
jgi:alpha-ketoglutarate-dependent taurine dioxygenase